MQRTELTVLHQDLNLISQGQCSQLGHGQDIAGSHGLVPVRSRVELEEATWRSWETDSGGVGQETLTHFSSSGLGGMSIMRYSLYREGREGCQQLCGLCLTPESEQIEPWGGASNTQPPPPPSSPSSSWTAASQNMRITYARSPS